jgi:hypothetical protein
VIDPAEAVQVTAVLLVPVIVAVNVCEVPPVTVTVAGEIVTEIPAAAVTVTVAVADFVVSATLVAVTVYEPADAGAV